MARGDNVAEMGFLLPVRLAADSHVSPILDVPLPPTDVAAVAGVESATVTWQIPEDNGGRPIQGYRVQSAPAGTTAWTTRIVTAGFSGHRRPRHGTGRRGGGAVPGGGDQRDRYERGTRRRR